MDTSRQLQIAQIIKDQLYASGRVIVWRWGAHNWIALPQTNNYLGGLQFKVEGLLYQGKVRIWLADNDTYTVVLDNLAEPFEDVYDDMLTDLVDGLVETK